MKLSEAIRLGAMALPRATPQRVFDYDEGGNVCAACAIGAAAWAVGIRDGEWFPYLDGSSDNVVAKHFPLVAKRGVPWPPDVPVTLDYTVGQMCSSLHETWRYTREQVADWVESVERTYVPPASEAATSEAAVARDGEVPDSTPRVTVSSFSSKS